MEVLIKHGADVYAINDENETALSSAKKTGIQMKANCVEQEFIIIFHSGNRECGKLLVNNGAKRNVKHPKPVKSY